jgi:hypothetical protein
MEILNDLFLCKECNGGKSFEGIYSRIYQLRYFNFNFITKQTKNLTLITI